MNQNPHLRASKTAVLLLNLGTPSAPTPKAVRAYLKEFLSDPRVVEIPRFIWWFILNGIILPIRSSASAKKYASIWLPQLGSPLMHYSRLQAKELQEKFTSEVAKWFSDNGDQTLRVNYQLSENSNVIDLGGYEGKWSKKIQDIYGCNVHIFEPIPEFYENIKNIL